MGRNIKVNSIEIIISFSFGVGSWQFQLRLASRRRLQL